ncbi:MAG: amino acid permease [Chitinophagaceae bacterium]|nr:amino acid permease [Chitinophagaceae bacterium]
MLWGLGVGYVISGMFFGWNLGLEKGGSYGFAIATLLIIILYACFTFGYAELACAIPKAGGVFDYANKALGIRWGFIAGLSQNIEFIFAPPAIALGIGSYLHIFLPQFSPLTIAIGAYLFFTAINIYGVQLAAKFELGVTVISLLALLVFAIICLPFFSWKAFSSNPLPQGWQGSFASIPFAIWFFLGIEGVANMAEETINPKKTLLLGFGAALLTLIIVCILSFAASVGINGWEKIVYDNAGNVSDAPLPLALAQVLQSNSYIHTIFVIAGIAGLIASFHGIILSAGRANYEFSKMKCFPAVFGKIHPRFQTPANALLLNMFLGICILLTGKTAEIITIAVFAALSLYILSMYSLIVLRQKMPFLERPFLVPFYPYSPIIAISIGLVCLIAMVWYNLILFTIFISIIFFCFLIFIFINRNKF